MATDLSKLDFRSLRRGDDRAGFRCGEESLDAYLQERASQDVKRHANGVFVMVRPRSPDILGYYTLCATALPPSDVPERARKHVPRYPLVSATLLGRLAVSRDVRGKGLGGALLADALGRVRSATETVGSCMVVADAVDENAARFYEAHGFLRMPDASRVMLPVRAIPKV